MLASQPDTRSPSPHLRAIVVAIIPALNEVEPFPLSSAPFRASMCAG